MQPVIVASGPGSDTETGPGGADHRLARPAAQ